MNDVIVTQKLRKTFGKSVALDSLDLTVHEGEILGFLGPNGAGKSTTIRVLLGMLRPSGGTARVFGVDPWTANPAIRSRLAYVPGDVNLWPNLTGGEAIGILLRLRGIASVEREVARLLDTFQLDPRKKMRAYSKGNRQKVALVAALAAPVDLYIFDEPTSGLDPVMEQVFTDEVRRVAERGGTILLSSHILSEVERLCDRVSIIRRGVCVESGSLSQLRHLTRTEISYAGELIPELRTLVHDAHDDRGRVQFGVEADAMPAVLGVLAQHPVTALVVAQPSLEELFLRHYGDELAAEETR